MTTEPGFDPPRPERAEWTREHPMGEHEPEATPPTGTESEDGDRAEERPDSEGQRPYGGRPAPDPDAEHLPGEWPDEGGPGG